MEYKLIKYTQSYLLQLINLLDKTFIIQNKDKKSLVKWKYFNSIYNGKTIIYIALDDKGQVVGHYSSMPINVLFGKKEIKTTLSTDAATDPRHRGQGLISRLSKMLYEDVSKQGYIFSYGFPNQEGVVMDKHSKNYGYQVVGKFVHYFKFILLGKKTQYTLKAIKSEKEIISLDISEEGFFKINKSKSYIIWRYLKKPNNDYLLYSINHQGQIEGYVVLRFYKRRCYVFDIITKKNTKGILDAIENKALDYGARIVIYNVFDNKYWRNFFSFPYFRLLKRNEYYFSLHPHKNNFDSRALDAESWILSVGDIL